MKYFKRLDQAVPDTSAMAPSPKENMDLSDRP
jgi:hypothetical protein